MFKLVFLLVYLVLYPFFRLRVRGKENLPAGGCVVASNHSALIDPILIIFALGWQKTYRVMGKKELFPNKLFGAVLRWVGVFPVDRSKNDVNAMKTAIQTLKDGKRLIIFPEGTRVKEGQGEAKLGAAMFAMRTKVPIVPVYVTRDKRIFRRSEVIFGQPIPSDGPAKPTSEDYRALSEQMMAQIALLEENA